MVRQLNFKSLITRTLQLFAQSLQSFDNQALTDWLVYDFLKITEPLISNK